MPSKDPLDELIDDMETPKVSQKTKKNEQILDPFEVFGLEKNASLNDIKIRYRNLVQKYHPDKSEDGNGDAELFKLIQHSYEILKDDKKRMKYINDLELIELTKNNDFFNMKAQFEKYLEITSKKDKEGDKERAKLEFERAMYEMDNKVGFSRKNIDDKLSTDDIKKRLDDIQMARSVQDNESTTLPKEIMDRLGSGNNFDSKMFNYIFEQKFNNKRGKNEIMAFNGMADASNNMSYATFQTPIDNYGEMFGSATDGADYGRFESNISENSDDDEDDIDNLIKNYGNYNAPDIKTPLSTSEYDKYMKEREDFEELIKNKKIKYEGLQTESVISPHLITYNKDDMDKKLQELLNDRKNIK